MSLEDESIAILREAAGQFENPVMLFSAGKDSTVLAHLAHLAFYPAKIPFPFLHVDTGMKMPEMYAFRSKLVERYQVRLIIHREEKSILDKAHPSKLGTAKCCSLLKTKALLDALRLHKFDAAIGGARRDEEKARAKERIFSFRDKFGQWDVRNQRPELWKLYNGRCESGESFRVFPLSNWTELDVWRYIQRENIPVAPLYFSQERTLIYRGLQWLLADPNVLPQEGEERIVQRCRFRTLGCSPCTGAILSEANTVDEIIAELETTRHSERALRIIDHDSAYSMEKKKQEGYF